MRGVGKKDRLARLKKVGGAGVGSAMAGLDAAVFRDQPPTHEVVEEHRHHGPTVTGDGKVQIVMPDDVVVPDRDGGSG